MSQIKNEFINALLADASYIDLTKGEITTFDENSPLGKRLTPTLAAYIAENFEV